MKFLIQQIIDQVIIKKALLNDYPKPGVIFLALDRLFNDPRSRKLIAQAVLSSINPNSFDAVAGIASRGFIFSGIIANHFKEKEEFFVQKVKVAGDANFVQIDTKTEYSSDALQVLKNTISAGKKYLLTDDLIATGGSVLSAIRLIRACGGQVDTVLVLTELAELGARELLAKEGVSLVSLLQFTPKDLQKLLLMQSCYENNSTTPITYQLQHDAKNSRQLIKANQSAADLRVHLGSKSVLKVEATQLACQGLFDPLNINLLAQEAPSGVNMQPLGYEETLEGASNRLKALEEQGSSNEHALLVSIENGLRYTENGYVDFVQVLVKKGQHTFSYTQDCCPVPSEIVNAIPKDKHGAFLNTWGEVAKQMGLAKDANNPHQEALFGGVSRTKHLVNALSKALGQLKEHMLPDCMPEIEAEQVPMKRLLELDSKKAKNTYAKRGIFFSGASDSINSRPINFYNQGIPAQSWNIDPEKIARNSFKVFSTGDAFSLMSPDIEIRGAHINIHLGIEHADYSPLVLMQEGLQLCRCAYEHGARSITIALPEQFHPLLHYGDFNSLLIKLFKASGANRIYFYDKNYRGKLDESTLHSVLPLTLANQADQANYQLDRGDLLDYLHASKRSEQLSLDYQVMQHTRQYHFDRTWSKLSLNQADSFAYLGGLEAAELNIPEIKAPIHVLLCCSANKPLAEEIAASLRRRGELVRLYAIQGQGAQAQIPNAAAICGAVVTIVQSTRPNPDHIAALADYQKNGAATYFFEAATIARQARLRGAQTINLINPYQFNARSDKAEDNPKGRTGAYVQQNGMLLEAAGVNQVITAECHDNHTMSGTYTGKKIRGSAVSALSVIASRIATQWLEETDSAMHGQLRLVTPDAGAAKRTKELTQQLQAILGKKLCQTRVLGDKQRDSHKDDSALINSLNSGDVGINPNDKYLITDDETATGSTLCQAISNLKKSGAQDIAVIVVHNNMPLDWLSRQLCLARFLYLGVNDLHFSNTQEMGTLAKSYEDLLQQQAKSTQRSTAAVEAEVFHWFTNNIATDFSAKTQTQIQEEFKQFQSMFSQFATKIKIHSLANEFAHQVATKPYMGNPYAFDSKVNEYISKIKDSQAQSIVVFAGVSVAAAAATALALNLPLQVIANSESVKLPNHCFALIGTPSESTVQTTGGDGFALTHTPADPEADLVIHQPSSAHSNEAQLQVVAPKIDGLLSEIEWLVHTMKQDNKSGNAPIKLLGIGVEGQLLAGQLSYLLNKMGIYVGIAAVNNQQALPGNPVAYSGQSGAQILSIDRNSLDMGDRCIAIAAKPSNDTKIALKKLATEAKVHCSYCGSLASSGDYQVANLDAVSANTVGIAGATKAGLLFFPNPSPRTTVEQLPLAAQSVASASVVSLN